MNPRAKLHVHGLQLNMVLYVIRMLINASLRIVCKFKKIMFALKYEAFFLTLSHCRISIYMF